MAETVPMCVLLTVRRVGIQTDSVLVWKDGWDIITHGLLKELKYCRATDGGRRGWMMKEGWGLFLAANFFF